MALLNLLNFMQLIVYYNVAVAFTTNSQFPFDHPDASGDIITGIYKPNPEIQVINSRHYLKWKVSVEDIINGQPDIKDWLKDCLRIGISATEMKWMSDGSKIAALLGNAAVVINYSPNNQTVDKKVVFGVCTDTILNNTSHTLEALPNNRLSIATTGQTQKDGIWLYYVNPDLQLSKLSQSPPPLQKITCHPAVHAMIWDSRTKILWAAGNDKAADCSECRSYGLLNGYQYNSTDLLEEEPAYSYRMPTATQLITEWGKGTSDGKFWDGPHDIAPVPNQRKFLISTDLDVHEFDLETQTFRTGDAVAATYLKGFVPLGDRTGKNRTGQMETLPRSDLKSISLAGDRSVVYNQATWADGYLSKQINILDQNNLTRIRTSGSIYKARWFGGVPGWETAQWSL